LGLERPVMGERLDSLSYFFGKIAIAKQNNASNPYCKPWYFTCKNGLLDPSPETSIFMKEVMDNSLGSRAFAEINTREAQLRLAIIPKKKLRSFAWVVVSYEWRNPNLDNPQSNSLNTDDPNQLSRDIASEVSQIISGRLNIWRFFTHITTKQRSFEKGSFEFFACLINDSQYDHADLEQEWRSLKESFSALRTKGATIIKTSVSPLAFKRVFLSMRTNLTRRREIVTICSEVGSQYGMLPEDFRIVETYIHPAVPTVVREIQSSHAMIQYYGNTNNDSNTNNGSNNDDWLHAELLAAQVLELPVVTIVEGEKTPKTTDGKSPIRIPVNPSRDDVFSAIEKALREIHGIREY
jgi:hypothetical protein